MTHALRKPCMLLGLVLATLWTTPILAEEDPTWYQVEMIVFERTSGADSIEQWPRNIQLRYPINWVALAGSEIEGAEVEGSDMEGAEETNSQEPTDDAERPSWDNGLAALNSPQERDSARTSLQPLEEDARSLDRFANAMDRSGQYRVLFHEAWRQPVTELDDSPALLIQGGDAFDSHTELEGSITLSVSRYLHLHTRLWFTEFEPNYGQPPGAWPELPRRPDAPQPELDRPVEDSWSTPSWGDEWQSNTGNAWDMSLNTTSSLPDFLGDDYVPRRIVTMNQQRRMRSDELHYLDHPIIGLLIRVTPYEQAEASKEE